MIERHSLVTARDPISLLAPCLLIEKSLSAKMTASPFRRDRMPFMRLSVLDDFLRAGDDKLLVRGLCGDITAMEDLRELPRLCI